MISIFMASSDGHINVENTSGEEHAIVVELDGIDRRRLILNQGGGGGGGEGGGGGGGLETQLNYANKLSSREMDSLTALCDTFLPSVDPLDAGCSAADESAARFFQTSASMAGTPEHLAGLISERLGHHVGMIRLTLWLLSTRIGTLMVGGIGSVTPQFPYLHSFSELSLERRQQIMLSCSLSCFFLSRMFFMGFKILILFAFFTQLDEKKSNLSWNAIGYCGPDPDFVAKKRRAGIPNQHSCLISETQENGQTEENEYHRHEEELFGPLCKGIVRVEQPRELIAESLRNRGFRVSMYHTKKRRLTISDPALIIQCDAVVIGSGNGGGVVAGMLAKAGYKVLVLEKGKYCARTNLSLLEGPTLDQMYEAAGLLSTQDLGVLVLAGSTVGGGSTVNWSASIRTPEHVIRDWSQTYGLELFDSKLYKEAMNIVCERMGVQHDVEEEGLNNAILREGCLELGYPVQTIPRNSSADHYCGWCGLGCSDGRKKGTAETWLKDLVNSGNGSILPNCEATKVLHHRKKGRSRDSATGVAFEFRCRGAKELCIVESKVTIVACGALNTPALLRKSGLKNGSIGQNLHLHPATMAWGYFPETNSPLKEQKKSYEGGIMTAMSTVVANFDICDYGAIIQTPSLHPGLFSAVMPWKSGLDMKMRMSRFARTAHLLAIARDRGSGKVSSNPQKISYRIDATDEANLKKAVEKMLRILAAAGAEEIGTHHAKGESINVKRVSFHEFERFVKRESGRALSGLSAPLATAHQMGSCRMGIDQTNSAVNQMGETWEVEGLFVADSSVFPTALGVNPMVTVQATAYCTAHSVLQVLKRKRN